jgi:hypothetical protein
LSSNPATGLEDVLVIFVADEAHLLDVRPLRDREHFVDDLIAGRCVGLQVQPVFK